MTICKCDRCGRELPLHELFVADLRPWDKPSQVKRIDLCEWCYRCLLDWVKADG